MSCAMAKISLGAEGLLEQGRGGSKAPCENFLGVTPVMNNRILQQQGEHWDG